jgi:hypothetical protein
LLAAVAFILGEIKLMKAKANPQEDKGAANPEEPSSADEAKLEIQNPMGNDSGK